MKAGVMAMTSAFGPEAGTILIVDDTPANLALLAESLEGRHIASIEESARMLEAWHNEFRVHHSLKGDIWIEGRSIPEREPDGSIRWYGFLHDVTKWREDQPAMVQRGISAARRYCCAITLHAVDQHV